MTKFSFLPNLILFSFLLFGGAQTAHSYERDVKKKNAQQVPDELKDIGIDAKYGETIDLDLPFVDEDGQAITLRKIFDNKRPVIMTLIYYTCPSLCNFHLNGLVDTLKKMDWQPGREFDLVAISIDPTESSNVAKAKLENYLEEYGRKDSREGWHFLTGSQSSIEKIAKQVGFKYKWNEEQKQWAHASAAMMIGVEGLISRYLYGVAFNPRDIRLAVTEAGQGKVGTVIDQLLLMCFRFDPEKNKYAPYVDVMRAGGGLTIAFLLFLMVPVWWRSRRASQV